jgi:hypothetical protein
LKQKETKSSRLVIFFLPATALYFSAACKPFRCATLVHTAPQSPRRYNALQATSKIKVEVNILANKEYD